MGKRYLSGRYNPVDLYRLFNYYLTIMVLQFSEEEVMWLIDSRNRRETRTVRLDRRLTQHISGGLSDILNLALKRFLEEKGDYGTSQ